MHARFNHPAIALVTRIGAAGLAFAFSLVSARLLGIAEFGSFSMALALLNMGVVLGMCGHETLATRQTARRVLEGDGDVAGFISSARRQVWGASFLFAAALAVLLVSTPSLNLPAGYLGCCLSLPFIAQARLAQSTIRGAHRAAISIVPDGLIRPVAAIAALGALAAFSSIGPTEMSVAIVTGGALAFISGRVLEHNAIPTSRTLIRSAPAQQEKTSVSLSIYASSVIAATVSQFSVIALGIFSVPTETGLYSAAERFSVAVAIIGQSIYLAIASRIAAAHKTNDLETLRLLVRRATLGASTLTVTVALAVWLFADQFLSLYGPDYLAGQTVLGLLLLSVVINTLSGPTGQLLLMTGHERLHLISLLASVGLQFALVPVVAPTHGALGVSIILCISTLTWNALMMTWMKRKIGLNPILLWA